VLAPAQVGQLRSHPYADLGPGAVGRLCTGTFDSTGQVCMAVKRLYVHRSRYDEIVDKLTDLLAGTRLGHGLDETVTMGPLHHAAQKPASSAPMPGLAGSPAPAHSL